MRRRRVPGAGDMLLRLISTNLGGEQRARTVWVQPSIIEADRIARPELVPDIGGAGDLAGVLPDRRARLPQPLGEGAGAEGPVRPLRDHHPATQRVRHDAPGVSDRFDAGRQLPARA